MNARGNALIVWRGADATSSRIYARARTAGGQVGAVQGLSDLGQAAYFIPSVAIDSNSNTVIAWIVFDGRTFAAQARARSAAGALGPLQPLSPAGKQADGVQVAMSPSGRALIVWQLYDGIYQRIQGRTHAAGRLSRVIDLSPPGQKTYIPQVALDATGDAVVTWGRLDTPRYRVEARARSAAGALGPIKSLSNPIKYSGEPEVAIAPDGKALVVWTTGENNSDWIQAATGPVRPELTGFGSLR
jgi:DNA-binding beta-propeller fold protein YncE